MGFTVMLQNAFTFLWWLLVSYFTEDLFHMPAVWCSDAALLVHYKYSVYEKQVK